MPIASSLQPDQDTARWDSRVDAYEQAFEPLTGQFAARTLDLLEPLAGIRLLDVAAGTGGAALQAARHGAQVMAVDASAAMTARIRQRASASVRTVLGDGAALPCAVALDALAGDRDAVAAAFAARLEADQGLGAVSLPAIAHIAVGRKAAITVGRKAMAAAREPT